MGSKLAILDVELVCPGDLVMALCAYAHAYPFFIVLT